MESNPRTGLPVEWSPPPAIVLGPLAPSLAPSPSPALPVSEAPRTTTEEEFDATLGGLVEHFAHLPPAAYGEPHELAMAEGRTNSAVDLQPSGSYLWTAVGLLVVGAALAAAAVVGWSYYKERQSSASAQAVQNAPLASGAPIKIIVNVPDEETSPPLTGSALKGPGPIAAAIKAVEGEGGIPQTEPLAEEQPAPQAAGQSPTHKHQTSAIPPRPGKPVTQAARSVHKHAPPQPQPERSLGARHPNASEDNWEDPYR